VTKRTRFLEILVAFPAISLSQLVAAQDGSTVLVDNRQQNTYNSSGENKLTYGGGYTVNSNVSGETTQNQNVNATTRQVISGETTSRQVLSGETTQNQNVNATNRQVMSGETTQNQNIHHSGTQTVKNVPNVGAPPLTSSNDTCMGTITTAVGVSGFGFSGGTTYVDDHCKRIKMSRELWNKGMKAASLALDCMDKDAKEALELTGFICPQTVRERARASIDNADARHAAAIPNFPEAVPGSVVGPGNAVAKVNTPWEPVLQGIGPNPQPQPRQVAHQTTEPHPLQLPTDLGVGIERRVTPQQERPVAQQQPQAARSEPAVTLLHSPTPQDPGPVATPVTTATQEAGENVSSVNQQSLNPPVEENPH
jgi:hypothetical protein